MLPIKSTIGRTYIDNWPKENLPAWHSNRLKRLVKTPKLHMGDTGLASALLGLSGDTLWADRSLRKLKDAEQTHFAAGVVLYDGEAVAGFGDRQYAVPITQLWEGD